MFVRGISILSSSAVDVGNISVPRPWDAWEDACIQGAMRAMQWEAEFMPLSKRLEEPERYRRIQRTRRELLETFLWIEPNADALKRMADLISQICEEGSWSAGTEAFDDPAHPQIDLQAAETGILFAWLLRRHGARLAEFDARIPGTLLDQVRRRLLKPVSAHDDYDFMDGHGYCPALILADLLLCAVLMERLPSHRQQPVKLILRMLDRLCATSPPTDISLQERLVDCCAVADLVRLLKRLTRGELDLTRLQPPSTWLDEVLIPYVTGDWFCDPSGADMHPALSGLDVFRLGYFSRDTALSALGAQMHRIGDKPAFSVSGRILSMEYMRALEDVHGPVPRLRRAASENNLLMISRMDAFFTAIWATGKRKNAGSIALFAGSMPILADIGGNLHSLPLIEDFAPEDHPSHPLDADADFGADRDLMSVDLTSAYGDLCPLSAYQRTLMTLQRDGTVRLVDAFEFTRPVQQVCFRFISIQKPVSLREVVRLGPVTMSWDGDMLPHISPLPPSETFPDGAWILSFLQQEPPTRFICGFTFEMD